jgi:hypothetical protein
VSLVPSFSHDVFISYAHRDDAPWREGSAGWVSEFVRTLKAELESRNRAVNVWFDPQLRTGDDFNLAIEEAISGSAVFLAFLSPAYDDCAYCRREIAVFREQRHPAFGLKVGTLSRIQGVVIKELPESRWPPEFRTTSPFRFYNDRVARFNKPSEADEKHPYVQGIWRVADSITAAIEEMRRQKQDGTAIENSYNIPAGHPTSLPIVCLADVSDDLYYKREQLRLALEQLKEFRVLSLDSDFSFGTSALSVHLFSSVPGRPVAGGSLPLARLQLEAVLKANPARRPIIWMPRDLDPGGAETEQHKQFLYSLLNQNAIELLRTGFEDLKEEIAKRMRPNSAVKVSQRRGDPIVHIWQQDEGVTPLASLKQYLKRNNCGISVFSWSSLPREKLQSKLAVCDGLIVPYTTENKSWAEDVMTEAFQLRRREERPLAFAAVELPPPGRGTFNFEHPRIFPVQSTQTGEFRGIDEFLAGLGDGNV